MHKPSPKSRQEGEMEALVLFVLLFLFLMFKRD